MFGPLGFPELIFILVLALLVFGPKRLPQIGRTLGKAMGEFRRATTDLKRSFDTELSLEDDKPRSSALPQRAASEPAASTAAEPATSPSESPSGS